MLCAGQVLKKNQYHHKRDALTSRKSLLDTSFSPPPSLPPFPPSSLPRPLPPSLGIAGLPVEMKRLVVEALLDTLAHTTELGAAMEPMSPAHLSPLPDLHAALTKASIEFLSNRHWRPMFVAALRRSLLNLVDIYAPPPAQPLPLSPGLASVMSSRPPAELTKFDYMEVWWASGEAGCCESDGARLAARERPANAQK